MLLSLRQDPLVQDTVGPQRSIRIEVFVINRVAFCRSPRKIVCLIPAEGLVRRVLRLSIGGSLCCIARNQIGLACRYHRECPTPTPR